MINNIFTYRQIFSSGDFIFKNVLFIRSISNRIHGGALFFWIITTINAIIHQCTFFQCSTNNIFPEESDLKGGCIYLMTIGIEKSNLNISSTCCNSCFSKFGSFLYIENNFNINIYLFDSSIIDSCPNSYKKHCFQGNYFSGIFLFHSQINCSNNYSPSDIYSEISLTSTVIMTFSNFLFNHDGHQLITFKTPFIYISHSNFINNSFLLNINFIILINNNQILNFDNCIFSSNTLICQGTISSNISFKNCYLDLTEWVTSITLIDCYSNTKGPTILINTSDSCFPYIEKCIYKENLKSERNDKLLGYKCYFIQFNIFFNINSPYSGGALSFESIYTNITIIKNTFYNCISEEKGGSIFIKSIKLHFEIKYCCCDDGASKEGAFLFFYFSNLSKPNSIFFANIITKTFNSFNFPSSEVLTIKQENNQIYSNFHLSYSNFTSNFAYYDNCILNINSNIVFIYTNIVNCQTNRNNLCFFEGNFEKSTLNISYINFLNNTIKNFTILEIKEFFFISLSNLIFLNNSKHIIPLKNYQNYFINCIIDFINNTYQLNNTKISNSFLLDFKTCYIKQNINNENYNNNKELIYIIFILISFIIFFIIYYRNRSKLNNLEASNLINQQILDDFG